MIDLSLSVLSFGFWVKAGGLFRLSLILRVGFVWGTVIIKSLILFVTVWFSGLVDSFDFLDDSSISEKIYGTKQMLTSKYDYADIVWRFV